MRKVEVDAILSAMLQSYEGISDLMFCVGRPLQVEVYGQLKSVEVDPPIDALTPYQVESIALNIVGDNKWLLNEFVMFGSCDCSYQIEEGRFRVNVFQQRGNFAIVMRRLQSEVPSLEKMELPSIFQALCREKTGLILVTGATGSGKTTTLAAILNEINEQEAVHIVTLEDPIEFIHPHKKATFNQRELGMDFDTFPYGLRAALRQAPKVILVGEMRDRETVEIALTAAETGHLVLSTLHTIDAGQSVNRILGMFKLQEETQLRLRLADTLRWIVSQRLVPKVDEGRQLIMEIMGSNLRTREAVGLGESDVRQFYDIIESNAAFGWTTFDQSILRAYEADIITEETALRYASRKGKVTRAIDQIKKMRGYDGGEDSGLKLDTASVSKTERSHDLMEARYDIFEPGDTTALVCIDQAGCQKIVVNQLSDLEYKIHVGLFTEDVTLKLKTHTYDIVVVHENFESCTLQINAILHEIMNISSMQRRQQYVVLVGPSMATNDEMMAFIHSVDLVFHTADLANLKPVLRRGLARHKEFYRTFLDCLEKSG